MDLKVTNQGRVNNQEESINMNAPEIKTEVNVKETKDKGNGKSFDKKDIDKAIEEANKYLQKDKTHAEYSVYDPLNRIMIKIVDDKTDEVVLEVPPEKILDMVAKMCENNGIAIDKKA